jgi:Fe-S cluster assembly protein SufD
VAQTITNPTIDRAAIEKLSAGFKEPAWLRDVRLAAFERFESLPSPTDRSEGWKRLRFAYDATGLTDRSDVELGVKIVSPDPGVIVSRLHDALNSDPELIRQVMADPQQPISLHKDAARLEAGWQDGVLIRVPDGFEGSEPIRISYDEPPYNRTIIIVGRGAHATIVERHDETWTLALALTDIVLAEGAQVKFAFVQDTGRGTTFFSVQRARLARDSKLTTLNFATGGSLSKIDVEVDLRGQGAESDMLGLVFGENDQQFDFHTLQGHHAPDSRSDLLFKSALDDRSHSNYTGVISIGEGAPRSQAYQANRNLLLSDGARADTQPKLEILIDDVARCTHGATIGPVDDEQMFYLRTRGLDPDTASRMIVEGFFQEVFHKFGDERVTTDLAELIAPHVGRLGAQ